MEASYERIRRQAAVTTLSQGGFQGLGTIIEERAKKEGEAFPNEMSDREKKRDRERCFNGFNISLSLS